MKGMISCLVLIALTVGAGKAEAAQGDSWTCSVVSMETNSPLFGVDQEFISKNMKKIFYLVDTGAEITAVVTAPSFPTYSDT